MNDDFKPFGRKLAFVPVEAEPMQNQDQNMANIGDFPEVSPSPNSEPPTPPPQPPTLIPQKPHGKKWHPKTWWHWFQHLSRNKKIMVVSALAGVLIVLGAILWYYVLRAKPVPPPPPPPPVVKEEPKPTTVASPLTGVQVKPELAKLPVTGVMIENSPDARPQSGLYNAGVVFEAIAEGGITRFLTLFQEAKPEYIGPVRSVRPYYLDFLAPFDAPIAHAGGSGQALAQVRSGHFKDLEAFQNPAYYQRVSTRYAPHNLYTGRTRLLQLQKTKGWTSSKFTGFARKEEKKEPKFTAKSIDFILSGFYYNPHFAYDPKTNSYKRWEAGKPHTDERARKQINPKVVIALVMPHRYAGIYSVYGTQGKGMAYFFQDGIVVRGKWVKTSRQAQFKFVNGKGETIGLNPGQTWITIVGEASGVTYKP